MEVQGNIWNIWRCMLQTGLQMSRHRHRNLPRGGHQRRTQLCQWIQCRPRRTRGSWISCGFSSFPSISRLTLWKQHALDAQSYSSLFSSMLSKASGHRAGSGSVQQVTNCVAVCDCWADPGLDMVEQPAKEVTYKRNFKLPSWEFNTFFLGVSHCPIWLVTSLRVLNWPWSQPNGGSHMAVSPIHALLREFQIPMGFPYFPDRGPRTHIISRDFLLF